MKKLFVFLKKDVTRIIVGIILFITAFILEQFEILISALILYIAVIAVAGLPVFCDAVRGILRRDLLDEKFLMSIASVGAVVLGEWSEGAAVMLFFLVGETFEHMAVKRSRSSIRSLMDICPDEACVLIDGEEEIVDAEDVEIGSTIIIRPGERVPIDCTVISGSSDVDTSSMTGEAIPRSITVGDKLDSGVVVLDGLLTCKTLCAADESAAARVLALVENANENKSKIESFITKFSRFYTPIVVIAAVIIAVFTPILSLMSWDDSVYTALTFLVISCPCALVISVPMAFFGGIGGAASRGILFKGGQVFSRIATADTAAFDKTGTVTEGDFSVVRVLPCGITRDELLFLAASAEYASNHPIASCIKASSDRSVAPDTAEEIAGEGIIATIGDDSVAVGNVLLLARVGAIADIDEEVAGAVYVARNGKFVGQIIISDKVREEADDAIASLRRVGIKKTVILSGDRRENVLRVGNSLGIDRILYELSPEEKYKNLEELIGSSDKGVIYVGDGINDAPSLARADVGIAMGGIGQDSAIEAADIVIVTDKLTKIHEAILIARKTVAIAKENIVFALGVKGLILILGILGFANMWLSVFADVGVAVLAILNSMRALVFSRRSKRGNK